MKDIKTNVFLGYPIELENVCKVYPPTVKQIIENDLFAMYRELIVIDQAKLDQLYTKNGDEKIEEQEFIPNPLEYLISLAYNDESIYALILEAFKFFTKADIFFDFNAKEIVFGKLSSLDGLTTDEEVAEKYLEFPRLDENNYFDFQNLVRQAIGETPVEEPSKDPRIRRIKAKGKYREEIKIKENKSNLSFSSMLSSICCMGIGITPLNIGELTYAGIKELLIRYQAKMSYDTDIAMKMVPLADTKNIKPKIWISDLED